MKHTYTLGFITFIIVILSSFQILELCEVLNYTYFLLSTFLINVYLILSIIFTQLSLDFSDIDDNEQVLISHTRIKITLMVVICMIINTILLFQLYDVWKVLINVITYLPLIYILYKISKNVITNSKSQHIKRKTI